MSSDRLAPYYFVAFVAINTCADAFKPVALEHALRRNVMKGSDSNYRVHRRVIPRRFDDSSNGGSRVAPPSATRRYAIAKLDLAIAGGRRLEATESDHLSACNHHPLTAGVTVKTHVCSELPNVLKHNRIVDATRWRREPVTHTRLALKHGREIAVSELE